MSAALATRLRGQRCRVYGSELKVQVIGRIRYPDAFVVCTPLARRATVVDDPVIVFEILGEGTAGDDLVVKNAEYRDTPSVRRYVVLHQEDAVLALPEIGVEVPLAEVYEGLSFENDPGEDEPGA